MSRRCGRTRREDRTAKNTFFAVLAPATERSGAGHIGIDEAGRGCLAGPVVAGAALFPSDFDFATHLPGLDDSKRLNEGMRKRLAAEIPQHCLAHGVGLAWQDEIDAVNILNATFRAMCRAVLALAQRLERSPAPSAPERPLPHLLPDRSLPLLLIDGNKCIPNDQWLFCANGLPAGALAWEQYFPLPLSNLPVNVPELPPQRAVVGGDALVPAISAASVLAKSVRDALMERLDEHFPAYGFRVHKGYGTREHLDALGRHGPCPLHRQTFRRVRPEKEKGPEQLGLW